LGFFRFICSFYPKNTHRGFQKLPENSKNDENSADKAERGEKMPFCRASDLTDELGWSLNRVKTFVRRTGVGYTTCQLQVGTGDSVKKVGDYLIDRGEFESALQGGMVSARAQAVAHKRRKGAKAAAATRAQNEKDRKDALAKEAKEAAKAAKAAKA
jgi:hypothetical protein